MLNIISKTFEKSLQKTNFLKSFCTTKEGDSPLNGKKSSPATLQAGNTQNTQGTVKPKHTQKQNCQATSKLRK